MLSRIGAALGKLVSPIASTLATTSDQSNGALKQDFKRQKKEDLVAEGESRSKQEQPASQQNTFQEPKKFEEQVDEIEAGLTIDPSVDISARAEQAHSSMNSSKNGEGVTGTFLKLLGILQEKSPIGKTLATRSYQAISRRQSTSTKIQKGVMLNEEVK